MRWREREGTRQRLFVGTHTLSVCALILCFVSRSYKNQLELELNENRRRFKSFPFFFLIFLSLAVSYFSDTNPRKNSFAIYLSINTTILHHIWLILKLEEDFRRWPSRQLWLLVFSRQWTTKPSLDQNYLISLKFSQVLVVEAGSYLVWSIPGFRFPWSNGWQQNLVRLVVSLMMNILHRCWNMLMRKRKKAVNF